jgi:hypothetical protein
MIGYAIPSRNFEILLHLTDAQWKTIEECWIANMHTVLLHPRFDPNRFDMNLTRSIRAYKRWFIVFFTKGVKSHRDSMGHQRFRLINLDKGLKALKTISGYMQYYCCFDMKDINQLPPAIPFFRGYHEDQHAFEFTWFGGYLSDFRRVDRILSDQDLIGLCQIRTFGRALPCPSRKMCREDLKDQIKILTTERVVEPFWLKLTESVCESFGERLAIEEMPRHSHFSMSTSGCYEVSSQNGGQASYIRTQYMKYLMVPLEECKLVVNELSGFRPDYQELNLEDWICKSSLQNKYSVSPYDPGNLTDCFGRFVFPISKKVEGFAALFTDINVRYNSLTINGKIDDRLILYDWIYRSEFRNSREDFSRFLEISGNDKEFPCLSKELGLAILLLAVSEGYSQGKFLDADGIPSEPDIFLVIPGCPWKVPLWNGRKILRYKVVIPPKVKLTCLAEPGAKSRSLGNTQVWFTIVTRIMRFMIEPIIARDGRARIGLVSVNKMWTFLKFLQKIGYRNPVIQSTDYRASTDYIPLLIISSLWKSLTKRVKANHPFLVFLDLIISNRNLELLDFHELSSEIEDWTHRCGSFMGEPMSFMTLTVMNLAAEEASEIMYHNFNPPVGRDPVAVCGDDFLAVRSDLDRILKFKEVTQKIGFVFSWKDQISSRIGIFCEDHILIDVTGKISYVDVIKSRLLTPMTRQHSDNRSAILGKGRMLRNQLDYFENKLFKVHVMNLYSIIFNRVYKTKFYKNLFETLYMPIWLPPNCGGLGFPIMEESIPIWGWKYIKHVFSLLDIKDIFERYLKLAELRVLNSPSKKGISTWERSKKVLGNLIDKFSIHKYDGNIRDVELNQFLVYDELVIIDLLKSIGRIIRPDPYDPSKFDFAQLRNEAALIGVIPFDDLLFEIERIQNFESFLNKGGSRQQRDLKSWASSSKKYWRSNQISVGYNRSCSITSDDVPKFTSFVALENKVNRSTPGWIYLNSSDTNLFNSSASLKIDFNDDIHRSRKKIPTKLQRAVLEFLIETEVMDTITDRPAIDPEILDVTLSPEVSRRIRADNWSSNLTKQYLSFLIEDEQEEVPVSNIITTEEKSSVDSRDDCPTQ